MFSILIGNKAIAHTPKCFGVNVEVQDHYEKCNLWDWLTDSGSTVIREFHPEKYLRREPLKPEQLSFIKSKTDFDNWRKQLLGAPEKLPWDMYMFKDVVPWLGVPDGIIGKVKEGKMEPIVSVGYYPRMFSEPLLYSLSGDDLALQGENYLDANEESPLEDGDWEKMPSDEEINWRAAACAYEYYFAFMYHYIRDFKVKYFNLHNEPEFHYHFFHYPPELMPDPPQHYHKYGRGQNAISSYMAPIIIQMAVLSKIAEMVCEDVRAGLNDPELVRDLSLSGPAWAGNWKHYWDIAHSHADICDYHCYTHKPEHFEQVHRRVAIKVQETPGKKTACTEYGRKGGPVRVSDLLFNIEPALEAAGIMMTALSFTRPNDPPCEFTTFYHFRFPATHRNYKGLVYGDMNLLDWSGRDKPLMDRGGQLYPSFEQLQLRYPTAGYHMFRMLARCAPGKENKTGASFFPVLDNGTSSAAYPADSLRTLAVDTGRDLIVNIQNQTNEKISAVEIDFNLFTGRFKFAVVRETSAAKSDELVSQMKVEHDHVLLDIPAQSLTQVIFTPLALDKVTSLRLEESTTTPGNASGLGLHQTTIFKALGMIDGCEYDLSQMNILWKSNDREALAVYQGGLTVCMAPNPGTAVVSAETVDCSAKAEIDLIRI